MIANPDNDVLSLIEELHSLRNGETTVTKLAACGVRAIGPLQAFLFFGKPRAIYQPRQLAVEALAALGARDVLRDYLRLRREIPDPAARFGEEAVESTAARLLGSWQTEDTFTFLLALARERTLSGLIDSLGEFRRPEALPFLEHALEDDYYRPSAEEALRKFGNAASHVLLRSAVTRSPANSEETPSSLRRRRSATRLLAEAGIGTEPTHTLLPLLSEDDPAIVVAACKLLSASPDSTERAAAWTRLMEIRPRAGWHLQDDIEECLGALPRVRSGEPQ